jgi:hypothetical protein
MPCYRVNFTFYIFYISVTGTSKVPKVVQTIRQQDKAVLSHAMKEYVDMEAHLHVFLIPSLHVGK